MSISALKKLVAEAQSETAEVNAIIRELSKQRAVSPHKMQEHRGEDRKITRVYLWERTPWGALALVAGPSMKGTLYEVEPVAGEVQQGEVDLYVPAKGATPAYASFRKARDNGFGSRAAQAMAASTYYSTPFSPASAVGRGTLRNPKGDGTPSRRRRSDEPLEVQTSARLGESAKRFFGAPRMADEGTYLPARLDEPSVRETAMARRAPPGRAPVFGLLYDAAGRRYRVVYRALATAINGSGPVLASNLPNSFDETPGYPAAFQARSLSRLGERQKIDRIARELDPARYLLPHADPTFGAPVVWEGNGEAGTRPGKFYVLGGNSRTIAFLMAGPQQIREYDAAAAELWPDVWPNEPAPAGHRWLIVRQAYPDTCPSLDDALALNAACQMSFERAQGLAGATQQSMAGRETPLGEAVSLVRGLGISGDLAEIIPSFKWRGSVARDNIAEFLESEDNRAFLASLRDRIGGERYMGFVSDPDNAAKLVNSVLIGFLPKTIIERGFGSEREERALLGALPAMVTIRMWTRKKEIPQGFDLLPHLEDARQFADAITGMSMQKARAYVEQMYAQQGLALRTAGGEEVRALGDRIGPLGVLLGLTFKRAEGQRDPTIGMDDVLVPYTAGAWEAGEKFDIGKQAGLFGGGSATPKMPADYPAQVLGAAVARAIGGPGAEPIVPRTKAADRGEGPRDFLSVGSAGVGSAGGMGGMGGMGAPVSEPPPLSAPAPARGLFGASAAPAPGVNRKALLDYLFNGLEHDDRDAAVDRVRNMGLNADTAEELVDTWGDEVPTWRGLPPWEEQERAEALVDRVLGGGSRAPAPAPARGLFGASAAPAPFVPDLGRVLDVLLDMGEAGNGEEARPFEDVARDLERLGVSPTVAEGVAAAADDLWERYYNDPALIEDKLRAELALRFPGEPLPARRFGDSAPAPAPGPSLFGARAPEPAPLSAPALVAQPELLRAFGLSGAPAQLASPAPSALPQATINELLWRGDRSRLGGFSGLTQYNDAATRAAAQGEIERLSDALRKAQALPAPGGLVDKSQRLIDDTQALLADMRERLAKAEALAAYQTSLFPTFEGLINGFQAELDAAQSAQEVRELVKVYEERAKDAHDRLNRERKQAQALPGDAATPVPKGAEDTSPMAGVSRVSDQVRTRAETAIQRRFRAPPPPPEPPKPAPGGLAAELRRQAAARAAAVSGGGSGGTSAVLAAPAPAPALEPVLPAAPVPPAAPPYKRDEMRLTEKGADLVASFAERHGLRTGGRWWLPLFPTLAEVANVWIEAATVTVTGSSALFRTSLEGATQTFMRVNEADMIVSPEHLRKALIKTGYFTDEGGWTVKDAMSGVGLRRDSDASGPYYNAIHALLSEMEQTRGYGVPIRRWFVREQVAGEVGSEWSHLPDIGRTDSLVYGPHVGNLERVLTSYLAEYDSWRVNNALRALSLNLSGSGRLYDASPFTGSALSLSEVVPQGRSAAAIEGYLRMVFPRQKVTAKVDRQGLVRVELGERTGRGDVMDEGDMLPPSTRNAYRALSQGGDGPTQLDFLPVAKVKIPFWAIPELSFVGRGQSPAKVRRPSLDEIMHVASIQRFESQSIPLWIENLRRELGQGTGAAPVFTGLYVQRETEWRDNVRHTLGFTLRWMAIVEFDPGMAYFIAQYSDTAAYVYCRPFDEKAEVRMSPPEQGRRLAGFIDFLRAQGWQRFGRLHLQPQYKPDGSENPDPFLDDERRQRGLSRDGRAVSPASAPAPAPASAPKPAAPSTPSVDDLTRAGSVLVMFPDASGRLAVQIQNQGSPLVVARTGVEAFHDYVAQLPRRKGNPDYVLVNADGGAFRVMTAADALALMLAREVEQRTEAAAKWDRQADEERELQRLGAEVVPGIRFGDALQVGRVWRSLERGEMTRAQWDDYVDQLRREGRVSSPPPAPAPAPAADAPSTSAADKVAALLRAKQTTRTNGYRRNAGAYGGRFGSSLGSSFGGRYRRNPATLGGEEQEVIREILRDQYGRNRADQDGVLTLLLAATAQLDDSTDTAQLASDILDLLGNIVAIYDEDQGGGGEVAAPVAAPEPPPLAAASVPAPARKADPRPEGHPLNPWAYRLPAVLGPVSEWASEGTHPTRWSDVGDLVVHRYSSPDFGHVHRAKARGGLGWIEREKDGAMWRMSLDNGRVVVDLAVPDGLNVPWLTVPTGELPPAPVAAPEPPPLSAPAPAAAPSTDDELWGRIKVAITRVVQALP